MHKGWVCFLLLYCYEAVSKMTEFSIASLRSVKICIVKIMDGSSTDPNPEQESKMSKREPNKFLAPIVIAGITVGFLMSAYKFIFAKLKVEHQQKKP